MKDQRISEIDKTVYNYIGRDVAWPLMPVVMAEMETGTMVYVSPSAAAIFGYRADELIGQQVEVLVPRELRQPHAAWRKDAAVPRTRLMGVGRQLRGVRKDGSEFPAHIGLTAMEIMERRIGIAFVIDLSEVVRAAERQQQLPRPASTVLVVDDDPNVSLILRSLVASAGHLVLEANSAERGLELIREEFIPDIIVLDLRMPDTDGIGFLDLLRKQARTAEVPVIVLTGYSDQLGDPKLRGCRIMRKPPNPPELLAAIAEDLAAARAGRG